MLERIMLKTDGWAWAAMVALLPITSMPLIVALVGSDAVAAPSGIFLLFLVLAWLVPFLIRRGALAGQALPFLGFVLAAMIATAAAAFLAIPPFRQASFFGNELKALFTLMVGLCFYLVAATFPLDVDRLTKTIRLINWSGLAILLWSLAQGLAWFLTNHYPEWMRSIQGIFTISPLYRARITGFALEPSWLAHQLNMLYLPIWLAASVRRFSAHRLRIWKFTLENMLLVGGVAGLLYTFSRVGMLAFALTLFYLLIRGTIRLGGWLQRRIAARWVGTAEQMKYRARLIPISVSIIFIAGYLGVLLGGVYGLSRVDPRMKDVFFFDYGKDNPILRYANSLTFASRLVYWQAGWEVYNDHPWLGVGLGNAGYYFPQKLSAYSWGLYEVRDLVFRSNNLLNTKSLWVRILAETGTIGLAFFLSWLYLLWKTAFHDENQPALVIKTLGLAGKFLLLGLIFEGFSLDSFALPYVWFSAGLLTAAYSCQGKEKANLYIES
jgi:O-antigen ligase